MKKWIALLLVLAMVLTLAACGAKEEDVIGLWRRETTYLPAYGCDADMYIAFADIYCLVKYSKVMPNLLVTIFKPLTAAVFCGVAAFGTNYILSLFTDSRLVAVVAILVAVLVYIVAIAVLKCIDEDDVNTLPKGEKVVKICKRFGIIRH